MLRGEVCGRSASARTRSRLPFSSGSARCKAPRHGGFGRGTCWSATAPSAAAVANEAGAPAKPGEGKVTQPVERKGMIDTQPPRGTRDFPPEDMRLRNWLFGEFAAVSTAFGFEQFDAPVLESEELFVRKAGEEITEQLYNFEDKGGRRVALRPELTPSLARLVLQRGKQLPLPAKWFAIGQCWRYERMTRGRRREHYQWNMDIVGVPGVEAEAELLAAIVMFFQRVGLTAADVGIKVSNRKVLQSVLTQYGVPPESFAKVCVIVDKLDKLPREKVEEELRALGVAASTIDGVLGALQLRDLEALAALLGPESEAVAELRKLWELAAGYGFQDWLVFDPSVVRGLAYYTGTVFEARDRAGQLRAICGGGRYDKLLATFGATDNTPMAGFGFGDAVIVELLKERGLLPAPGHRVDDVVVPLDGALRPAAAGIATALRRGGRSVDLVLEAKKMKWAFKHAEKLGAARLVLVGTSEWERGAVVVKDLAKFEQKEMPVAELTAGAAPPPAATAA
ncbi:hypothetical protein HYH02_002204 [Chlamydomonas schloesseri]|uniref:histidine--tRNA ligase n=1 Tax=Chlamydomonas schloesseri TaxID=2026947 RepID=A0A835WSG6_9CHLO|nr:hypothetical protein HYH02_002204 [Chlamydomonas schloesseri]|eukprot:KAG2452860.1 hypothetical protein HYH02_002204 [Chlamydomonas schloesseri]